MTELSLPYVSIVTGGDEYFQVSFDEQEEGSDGDTPYFLLQRQLESPDGGRVYVESHQRALCGHFRIRRAALSDGVFHLELAGRPPQAVLIRFQADRRRLRQLTRVLETIVGRGILEMQ